MEFPSLKPLRPRQVSRNSKNYINSGSEADRGEALLTVTSNKTIGSALMTRLSSLDVMRGITVAFMIIVNNSGPAGAFWPLRHAEWNGWTPADIVFPTFLFVVGVSVVFALEAKRAKGSGRSELIRQAVRRSLILFLLGLFINAFPFFNFQSLRIYGVLQRIAICFLCASLIYIWMKNAYVITGLTLVCLLGYWALVTWIPVPGYGSPGLDVPLLDPNGNIVSYVDRQILSGRLYEGTRDPEGLLSSIPAIATVLFGVLTGLWLRSERSPLRKLTGLVIGGLICLSIGLLWDREFPINKNMWTSSFVLFSAGWALIILAGCYWAVEIKQWKRGWTYPWLVLGTNPMAAFVLSELLLSLVMIKVNYQGEVIRFQRVIIAEIFSGIQPPGVAILCYSFCFLALCFVPIAVLYHKRVFIKV
jgi:predicted acyltransferase